MTKKQDEAMDEIQELGLEEAGSIQGGGNPCGARPTTSPTVFTNDGGSDSGSKSRGGPSNVSFQGWGKGCFTPKPLSETNGFSVWKKNQR